MDNGIHTDNVGRVGCLMAHQPEIQIQGSNPVHGEVYSIQHYVIKFVSDLRQVGRILKGTLVSSTNKIDRHQIYHEECLRKVRFIKVY
jgi:hypothetical protein